MIDPELREFKAAVENEYATQRLERFEESLERLMNSRDFRIVLSYWLDRWKVGKVAWDSHSYNLAKNAGMQLVGCEIHDEAKSLNFAGYLKMLQEAQEEFEKIKLEVEKKLEKRK